jgi:hypothetical protein
VRRSYTSSPVASAFFSSTKNCPHPVSHGTRRRRPPLLSSPPLSSDSLPTFAHSQVKSPPVLHSPLPPRSPSSRRQHDATRRAFRHRTVGDRFLLPTVRNQPTPTVLPRLPRQLVLLLGFSRCCSSEQPRSVPVTQTPTYLLRR